MNKRAILEAVAAGTMSPDEASTKLGKPKARGGKARDDEFQALWDKAHAAGAEALAACTPTPMIVGSPSTPLGNDVDPTQKTYFVEGGACGFAWVKVRPATCAFARWMKRTGKVRGGAAYRGGYDIWISAGGQSIARKEAYARALADVLRAAGITAYADSRLD